MAAHRQDRIEEEIKKELSEIIKELKDPRISGLVSVIAVSVTKDLRYAKAYISVLGTEEELENTIKGLTSAGGYIRREIGARVGLRYTPEFVFKADSSIERGAYINSLINKTCCKGGVEDEKNS